MEEEEEKMIKLLSSSIMAFALLVGVPVVGMPVVGVVEDGMVRNNAVINRSLTDKSVTDKSEGESKVERRLVSGRPLRPLTGLGINATHEVWAKWLMKEHQKKTIRQLLAHRESLKTSLLALIIARHVMFNPDERIAIVRSTKREAENFLATIERILNAKKVIQTLTYWGLVKKNRLWAEDTKERKILSYRTKNWKEGNLDAIGLEQKITGRHYDLMIFDDAVTLADRLSPTLREKKYTYLSEYILNILSDKGLAINSGTFWHPEDASQRLKKAYSGEREIIFEEQVYPLGTVFKEDEKELERKKRALIKGLGRALYYANYELKAKSDDNLPFSKIKHKTFSWNATNLNGAIVATIDPAYDGRDCTAISLGGQVGQALVVVGKSFKENIYDIIPQIATLLKKYQVSTVWVETNADKGASARQLARSFASGVVRGFTAQGNKAYRIQSNLKANWDNIFFDTCKSSSAYLLEVAEWNNLASRDDAPDSLAKLVEVMEENKRVANPIYWG